MKRKSQTRLCKALLPPAKPGRRSKKGFTLTEFSIAISISLTVFVTAGIVLATSYDFWDSSWKKTNLQRDASYAMLKMSHHIKAGTSAETENDGTAIKIYKDTDNWIRFFLEQESNNLKCELKGQAPETIISGNVEDLEFEVDGNKVKINLILKKGDLETHLVCEAMIRNYGK
jgi:prepilin-type N-terminal cleavage/methylation domain-containing protein